MWDTMKEYLLDMALCDEDLRGTPTPKPIRRRNGTEVTAENLKRGDKVRVKRHVTREQLSTYSSGGTPGVEYIVLRFDGDSVLLDGSNWHGYEVLEYVVPHANKIGGKAL